MEPLTSIGHVLPAAVGKALVNRLFSPPAPGAGLVDDPVRLGGWVSWRGGKREVAQREIAKLLRKLELRATDADPRLRFVGPAQGELVAKAVAATLMALDSITMDDVQAAALDPRRLATTLSAAADPEVTDQLGEQAKVLYERLLATACLHILEFFSRRPEFLARTSIEQARQVKDLQDAVARLAEPPDDGDRFREDYVRHVIVQADKMQLFGMRLPAAEQTYALSTAYVTLSVNWDHQPDGRGSDDLRHRQTAAAFEYLLGQNERVLIEGPAGAGKTTLLRRLALHAGRGDLPSQAAAWRHRIPFLLRLRDFRGHDGELQPPAIEEFVGVAVPLLAGAQPAGWVGSALRDGKAVVLLDGVDELPQLYRPAILEWLEKLVELYPLNHYVVTSRPRVVGDDWHERLRRRGFAAARLEPMTPGQVDDFIDRWHSTVLPDSTDDERGSQLAESLKNALSARHDLSRLATNPLLCAMLCALNRNSNQYLPSGRIALYDDVLTMLLERRDEEQRISTGPLRLSRRQAQPLLSRMAIWMTINGERVISRDTALGIVEDVVPRFQGFGHIDPCDLPALVLDHLFERSGLLQAPALDQLEFLHPSLQDYLAAGEVFRQNHIPHLLRNAHDPLYHDVIIMAVAQAEDDPERQSELLNGLVERATALRHHSRRLWLLAAACVADTEMVDPELRGLIQAETARLLPPDDLDEADSVAGAGEFVLDLLADVADRPDLSSRQIAGIVRVAGQIGGEPSFALIRRFRRHSANEVQAEIIRAWTLTGDPGRYATEILADSAITHLDLPEGRLSPLLPRLERLRSLGIRIPEVDWGAIATMTGLRTLRLYDPRGIVDWAAVAGMPGLRVLDLSVASRVDWSAVAAMTGLRTLHLSDPVGAVDWTAIAGMTGLRDLHVQGTAGAVEWSLIASMSGLRGLHLHGAAGADWAAIATMSGLRALTLESTPGVDWTAVSRLTELRELRVLGAPIRDARPLSHLRQLEVLELVDTAITDVSPLSTLEHLRWLDLTNTHVADLRPVAHVLDVFPPAR
jgi:hypothetical protein